MGRMVLEVTITARLGDDADKYDIASLVKAYVERFGFVDIGEVDPAAFEELTKAHTLK